jgi:ribonuclease P protein component
VSARDSLAVARLQQWSEFQAVMAAGWIARTPHFVLHQWAPDAQKSTGPGFEQTPALFAEGVLYMGALTPKRFAKKAVTRNTIRRLVHETTRHWAKQLAPRAYVVRLRASYNPQKFVSATSQNLKTAVAQELAQLFSQAASK